MEPSVTLNRDGNNLNTSVARSVQVSVAGSLGLGCQAGVLEQKLSWGWRSEEVHRRLRIQGTFQNVLVGTFGADLPPSGHRRNDFGFGQL